jgi:hypothetical protein
MTSASASAAPASSAANVNATHGSAASIKYEPWMDDKDGSTNPFPSTDPWET